MATDRVDIKIVASADTAGAAKAARDLRSVGDAADDLSRKASAAQGPLGRFGGILAGFAGGLAAGAFSAVTSGISNIAGSFRAAVAEGIRYNATLEAGTTRLTTLLGSQSAARQRLGDLRDLAASTPFELPGILEASSTLETLTRGALAAGAGLRLVGDVASGTGVPIEQMAVTVGRLYDGLQSGRPVGEALSRLQELGAISGETRSRLEDLQKTGASGAAVWEVAAQALGRYSGQMQAASQTFDGAASTMRDNIDALKGALSEDIFAQLKVDMTEVNRILASPQATAEARALGQALGSVYETVRNLVRALQQVPNVLGLISGPIANLQQIYGLTAGRNVSANKQAVIGEGVTSTLANIRSLTGKDPGQAQREIEAARARFTTGQAQNPESALLFGTGLRQLDTLGAIASRPAATAAPSGRFLPPEAASGPLSAEAQAAAIKAAGDKAEAAVRQLGQVTVGKLDALTTSLDHLKQQVQSQRGPQ